MGRAHLSILLIPLAAFLCACGGDDTSSGSGTPTGSASGTGGGGGGAAEVNGCTTFTDASAIAFTFTQYTPDCVKIKKGGTVKWTGDFVAHPLQGGEVTATMATPDSSSPIGLTDMGMEKTITFPEAGTFGFYCTLHGSVGMKGAVLVE